MMMMMMIMMAIMVSMMIMMMITMISEHLIAHLTVMENVHLLLLLRYFAEPFILNTLPMFYRYPSIHPSSSIHLFIHLSIIIP